MNKMMRLYYKYFVRSAEANADYLKKHSGAKIGENCHLFKTFSIGSEPYLVSIGNNVTITSGVRLITHDGAIKVPMGLKLVDNSDIFGPISIGNNVFIGINSIILPNVNIGDNVIIGAGSVVTKNIVSNSVYAGNPAKYICSIHEYYEKNNIRILKTDSLNSKEKEKIVRNIFNISK